MSRPSYEIWLGEGRGTLLSSSFEGAKGILRRHFQGPVFLSDEYDTDMGVGWIAFPSAIERSVHRAFGLASRPDRCDEGPALPRIERWQREQS